MERVSKFSSLRLVLSAGCFLLILNWTLAGSAWRKAESSLLYWSFTHHLFFFLIPALMVWLNRDRRSRYGFRTQGASRYWKPVCFTCLPLLSVPAIVSIFAPIRVSETFATYPIATIMFQLVMVAAGEEIFFRGFCQGELNHAHGKPWRLGQVNFGWGVLAIALMFGIGHMLNPFSPLQGDYSLSIRGLVL